MRAQGVGKRTDRFFPDGWFTLASSEGRYRMHNPTTPSDPVIVAHRDKGTRLTLDVLMRLEASLAALLRAHAGSRARR